MNNIQGGTVPKKDVSFEYEALESLGESGNAVELKEAPKAVILDVQELLKYGKFYDGDFTGTADKATLDALSRFKKQVYLGQPTVLGRSTIESLIELFESDIRKDQENEDPEPESETTVGAGSRTGKLMKLPNGNTVYQNERIIQEVPLTWGEMTKGCSRVPVSNRVVKDIRQAAKLFGHVRENYGSPIGVNSGYRDPVSNRRCGGASRSQHLTGNAIDLSPLDGDLNRLYKVSKDTPEVAGLGDGRRKGFVHCDARTTGRTYWNY